MNIEQSNGRKVIHSQFTKALLRTVIDVSNNTQNGFGFNWSNAVNHLSTRLQGQIFKEVKIKYKKGERIKSEQHIQGILKAHKVDLGDSISSNKISQ